MKKTTRTLLGIGGAFCLIGALLFGIGFMSGGTKYVHATNLNAMNAQSDQDAKENHFTLEKTELSDFNSLNVNLKNSDFNIKESPNEKSYIEYVQETTKAKNPLSYSIKNNTLTLKENGNTGASYTISVDISFLQPLLSGKIWPPTWTKRPTMKTMSLSIFRKISCCLLPKSILDTVIFL